MDSVSNSLIDVANRDDVKQTIGDNVVNSVIDAIRKQFPNTLSYIL